MKPTRPILRYYGGKWKVAPWVITHFPRHRTYVEPFGGAGSVLLRKPRSYGEILNDIYGEVVNLYRVLQLPGAAKELQRLCEVTPYARAEFDLALEFSENPVERARRLIIRAFMGFGSAGGQGKATGFRFNANRSGTTPASDWSRWPAQIPAYIERLKGVVIDNTTALDCIRGHDNPEALIYADPPYLFETRRDKLNRKTRGRYAHEMTDDDHRELAAVLRSARGMVAISGYPSPLYEELYGDWQRDETRARCDNGGIAIEEQGGERTLRTEVLWLNPACAAALARDRSQREMCFTG